MKEMKELLIDFQEMLEEGELLNFLLKNQESQSDFFIFLLSKEFPQPLRERILWNLRPIFKESKQGTNPSLNSLYKEYLKVSRPKLQALLKKYHPSYYPPSQNENDVYEDLYFYFFEVGDSHHNWSNSRYVHSQLVSGTLAKLSRLQLFKLLLLHMGDIGIVPCRTEDVPEEYKKAKSSHPLLQKLFSIIKYVDAYPKENGKMVAHSFGLADLATTTINYFICAVASKFSTSEAREEAFKEYWEFFRSYTMYDGFFYEEEYYKAPPKGLLLNLIKLELSAEELELLMFNPWKSESAKNFCKLLSIFEQKYAHSSNPKAQALCQNYREAIRAHNASLPVQEATKLAQKEAHNYLNSHRIATFLYNRGLGRLVSFISPLMHQKIELTHQFLNHLTNESLSLKDNLTQFKAGMEKAVITKKRLPLAIKALQKDPGLDFRKLDKVVEKAVKHDGTFAKRFNF